MEQTGKKKKRVLVYYKDFISSIGGGRFLPLLFIAELQKTCEVTLALNVVSDLEPVAKTTGIPLDCSRLKIVQVMPDREFLRKLDFIIPFFRVRQLKKLSRDADVCISAANMIDFGKPAHHFVFILSQFGDNAFTDYFRHAPPKKGLALFKRKLRTFVAENFLRPLLGVRSPRKIIADPREHIYPTSRYVSDVIRGYYGPFNGTVFYPPTIFETTLKDVERFPLQVNYLGRISQEKCIEDIVLIVEQARKLSGLDFTLKIAGNLVESPYVDRLKQNVAEKPWIQLLGAAYGEDKERFLLSGTFAIHAERDEAFGIVITEYLKAGCIPIVPDEGGTGEIVDSPALTYHTNDDAARILVRLYQDKAFREEQLAHCMERAGMFSLRAYMESQRRLLEGILAEKEEK